MPRVDVRVVEVVTNAGTQSRVEISESTVADYADKMAAGEAFPPIVLFHDGSTYWLADGFHRVMAAARAGVEWIASDVHKGTKRDAILYSVGTNAAHGLPRTNADKRHAVTLLLQDEEWVQWSDREIARRCMVAASFVGDMRARICSRTTDGARKAERNGAVYTQQTTNIGRVVRKDSDTRAAEISALASDGHRASQIGDRIGLSEERVRKIAASHDIDLPDRFIGKTHKINNRRVIEQTVLSLDASAQSLNTISFSFDGISREEAQDWAQSVAESLKIFRQFHKQLNEVANV